MKMTNRLRRVQSLLVIVALLVSSSAAVSGELRFNFRNPNFGGNPLYGDFLINGAQLQNQHGDGGGGGGGGGIGGGDGGLGSDPFSSFQFPDPDDFSTGTTVIVGQPTS